MTISIALGWWLAPAFITVVAFMAARLLGPRMRSNGGIGEVVVGLMELLCYGAAAVVSLLAWLIWALAA
ncbi:MAG: hypothetical protein E5V66_14030 [Mesorhizobium sp.]|uniref:hypothetical protein n=1 Tax=Mesorhizobium sp. TaxID=1871066 RepID=UPI001211BF66|nr:hypothetical protein [Mesorhizobium sp.]TIW11279.1 MAG: hypothetical protein E5V66_14030 [Mesorhizobium sp.]